MVRQTTLRLLRTISGTRVRLTKYVTLLTELTSEPLAPATCTDLLFIISFFGRSVDLLPDFFPVSHEARRSEQPADLRMFLGKAPRVQPLSWKNTAQYSTLQKYLVHTGGGSGFRKQDSCQVLKEFMAFLWGSATAGLHSAT